MKKIDTLVIAVGGGSGRLVDYFKSVNFYNTKTLWPINGQPLLKYFIDMAFSVGFSKIFLLASFYENKIQEFVNNFYKDKNVVVVFGGDEGKKGGVNMVLSFINNQLDAPFVYSDGDILFDRNLFKDILENVNTHDALVKCVVSPVNLAATHSEFIIVNNRISEINLRYTDSIKKNNKKLKLNSYCSLGLMVISNSLFSFMPQYKDMNDLDVLVKELFCKNHDLIDYKIYKGDWFSIHTKEDIDKINGGYYDELLRSLT